jgi:EF-P beta-lysylation protein EpmB
MIPRTDPAWQTSSWQQQLAGCFTRVQDLFQYLQLDPSLLPAAQAAAVQFGLRVPAAYAARIERGNSNDPLLRQVLPVAAELNRVVGFGIDPVAERNAAAAPGILHKYSGRALLMTTGACAIHCRYCFRRHYPYSEFSISRERWAQTLAYLQPREQITEVILSGGDPLTLCDDRLTGLVESLGRLPHLRRLRIHSRLPALIPDRITDRLVDCMLSSPLRSTLVLHINHPREISEPLQPVLRRLRSGGVTLLNQSVLLRGINDSAETLCELSEGLFSVGILPYYLHLLDRVQGAAHFEVSEFEAAQLHREIRKRLPGYLLPRLVREDPGAESKTPLG